VDCNTGTLIYRNLNAHDYPIYSMLNYENLLATGDDNGYIKAWDLRQQNCAFEFKENDDFISDMIINPEHNLLLATSGDGTLGVYDIRKGKLHSLSDTQDDELLSLAILKNGKKVVCGTQDGILDIFSWDKWADISDRFPGHPKSIDTIVKVDEDTIFTGSSDGLIRVVQIHPNKLLGVIGEHEEFPIERIRLSRDNKYLGSCSHDNTVKFWNVEYLMDNDNENNEEENNDEENKNEENTNEENNDEENNDEENINEEDAEIIDTVKEKRLEKDDIEEEAPKKKKKRVKDKHGKSTFFSDL